jgi:hypothetical protein
MITNNDLQNITRKTKDLAILIPLKTGGKLVGSESVSSSCYISDTCCVFLTCTRSENFIWCPRLLSALQVHITTYCKFYREQQLGLASPKFRPLPYAINNYSINRFYQYTGGKLVCSESVSSSCYISDTCCVTVKHNLI